MKKKLTLILLAILTTGLLYAAFFTGRGEFRVLVFSKTSNYRHQSIANGKLALLAMGDKHGFKVDTTENPTVFKEKSLKNYKVIVFLSTTGDVLNEAQQMEMNRFVQAGGGFVGIHAAADTEYDWPWYGKLVGAYFESHPNDPNVRQAKIRVVDQDHEATSHLPEVWEREDEWYNYKSISDKINVLLELDESSYEGGTNGDFHPIAWYQEFDGGRSFYTGLGHTEETFSEPHFLEHLWGGISYAAGDGKAVNYNLSTVAPEENRFTKQVLDDFLDEPMELEVLDNGKVLFIERPGNIKLFDPEFDSARTIVTIPVFSELEDGLLGLAKDPDFNDNHWIYLLYSPVGEKPVQHVSRFLFENDQLDLNSEKVLLEIPTQREECCHSAGSMEFGPDGNLFIATGDNTSPRAIAYSPSDERPGRMPWDAQKSSSNTNDLRGKILRIRPETDGTYSIPEGNLFPQGSELGRPEIYVMGCRNPYRISIDAHTGFLYWGDVGPDAGEDSTGLGPKGYDEVNQAQKPGFFGWPYFIGDNYAYHPFDFEREVAAEIAHNPEKPINNSPNNTGLQELPPAQSAFIWYPYDRSKEFPLTGEGGRNAMAGPVFYVNDFPESDQRFPEYYDGKLITYDWMRGWMMMVSMDEKGNYQKMEPFLPNMQLNNPIDMQFAKEGSLYLLEYGTRWFTGNPDARLVRIDYIAGNRQPVARIAANQTIGAQPLEVVFDGMASVDFDGDSLAYLWDFGDGRTSSEASPTITFANAGEFMVKLKVSDPSGESANASQKILVGNSVPEVKWSISGNQSFYFDQAQIDYEVSVQDAEDGGIGNGIRPENVIVSIDYLENGFDITEIAQGHEAMAEASNVWLGKELVKSSNCSACHQLNEKSVGPAYMAVSERYKDDPNALDYLSNKIIKGGGGVWGEMVMAAHPQLKLSETKQMAKYILSLAGNESAPSLPLRGSYTLKDHIGKGKEGSYILTATYKDKGGKQIGSLTGREVIKLRNPLIMAYKADEFENCMHFEVTPDMDPTGSIKESFDLMMANKDGYLKYSAIDLTGISGVDFLGNAMSPFMDGGDIQVRVGSPDGEIIGNLTVKAKLQLSMEGIEPTFIPFKPVSGVHDLYFTFSKEGEGNKPILAAVTLEFRNTMPSP